MQAGVPQADLPVIATAQEIRLPGVNCQTPQLIGVTLQMTQMSYLKKKILFNLIYNGLQNTA